MQDKLTSNIKIKKQQLENMKKVLSKEFQETNLEELIKKLEQEKCKDFYNGLQTNMGPDLDEIMRDIEISHIVEQQYQGPEEQNRKM